MANNQNPAANLDEEARHRGGENSPNKFQEGDQRTEEMAREGGKARQKKSE